MKTILNIITPAATCWLFAAAPLQADNTAETWAAARETVVEAARAAQANAPGQIENARQYVRQGDVKVAQAPNPPQAPGQGGRYGGGAGGATPPQAAPPQVAPRLHSVVRRPPGGAAAGRTLVIRSAAIDAEAQVNLEEDLAVMAHILDKTLDENTGGAPRRAAMGIDLFFGPGARPIRSMYLEGYGALFMLDVAFPLLPPPTGKEESREKASADSSWDEARRELYGRPPDGAKPPAPAEDYDENKVTKLKTALLESLKSATNIRHLEPGDFITVTVFGGAGPMGKMKVVSERRDASDEDSAALQYVWQSILGGGSAPSRATVLTIRVKKADVDAFAKGRLSLDEFRRKASLSSYTTETGDGTAGLPFGRYGVPTAR